SATCLRRRSLQRSSCGPRGACRPRLFERSLEVPSHGCLERAAKRVIVIQKAPPRVGQAHTAGRPAARGALDEFEAGRLLELAQVAPRVAVRHLELRRRLLQRAARLDRLQQPRAAVAEFQVLAERDPDPQLRFHMYMGGPEMAPHNPQRPEAPRQSPGAPPLPPPAPVHRAPRPCPPTPPPPRAAPAT